jgi:hypothetical protein
MATSDFSVKGNLVINGIAIESDGVNINFPPNVTFDNQSIADFVEDSTGGINLTDLSASGDLVYNNVTGVFSVTTYKSTNFDADFANKTTTNLAEGTNFYFTTARARAAVSANTGLSYNASTGVFTNSAPDQTVVLTGSGSTSVSGTYPNFTITSSDQFIGTVTSVAASGGTGISVSGSPITTSGTITITNDAPDQVVVLTGSGATSVSGTYPNFTISSTDTDTTYTAGTGIDLSGTTFSVDSTVATLTGTQTLTNKTITAINYRETVGTITTGTLDLSTGNVFSDTPSANVTYTFSNPPASPTAYGFTLKVTPSATITVTWPASAKFPDGVAPVAPASGETAVYVFYTQDGGTTYFGFVAGEAMA